jgi:16S rRNA U516 pseudouridylate synthase RsuA-like enzyme
MGIEIKKPKRKLTASEKPEKSRRRKEYMTIFINGKQKRVKRPPAVEGLEVDEFIRRNADPIWLHQNEMWKYMTETDS